MVMKEIILFTMFIVAAQVAANEGFGGFNFPGFQFQFPGFPYVPFPQMNFPQIQVPLPGDLKNTKPGPGQMFSGIAVQSSSNLIRDKDGNLVPTGGTTVVTNNNGRVNEYHTGDAPPSSAQSIRSLFPALQPMKIPEMKPMKPFKFPEFDEDFFGKPKTKHSKKFWNNKFDDFPKMKPLEFPEIKPLNLKFDPINADTIKQHKPKGNEKFVGYSSSSVSHYSNDNGKIVAGGGSDTVINDNGKIDEENVIFGQGHKD